MPINSRESAENPISHNDRLEPVRTVLKLTSSPQYLAWSRRHVVSRASVVLSSEPVQPLGKRSAISSGQRHKPLRKTRQWLTSQLSVGKGNHLIAWNGGAHWRSGLSDRGSAGQGKKWRGRVGNGSTKAGFGKEMAPPELGPCACGSSPLVAAAPIVQHNVLWLLITVSSSILRYFSRLRSLSIF